MICITQHVKGIGHPFFQTLTVKQLFLSGRRVPKIQGGAIVELLQSWSRLAMGENVQ